MKRIKKIEKIGFALTRSVFILGVGYLVVMALPFWWRIVLAFTAGLWVISYMIRSGTISTRWFYRKYVRPIVGAFTMMTLVTEELKKSTEDFNKKK